MSNVSAQAVARSVDTIRWAAQTARDALGYEDIARVQAEHLIECALPQLLPSFVYDIQPIMKMGENHGLAYPDKDCIVLREDVYFGARSGNGRDLFTIAHEVGHLVLHQSENLVQRYGRGDPALFCQPEWQADTFAAEFLMDLRKIRPGDTPHLIARRFGVSITAAQRRVRFLAKTQLLQMQNEPGGK